MDKQEFWQLITAAREQAPDPDDGGAVAAEASALLAARPVEQILAAQQALWDLMADSCTNPLWPPRTSSTADAPTTASTTSAGG